MNAADRAEKLAELGSIREGSLPRGAAAARLAELLADEDDEVRAEAAEASTTSATSSADLVLRALELATTDRVPAVRAAALRGLGRVVLEGDLLGVDEPGFTPDEGEPDAALVGRARAALKAAFGKTGPERLAAIEGLACAPDDAVLAAIEALGRSTDRRERRAGLLAMARTGDGGRWGAAIVAALDGDRDVALAAMDAAADAGVRAAGPKLLVRLRGGDAQVAARAATALGALGGEVGSALLEAAEGHEDDEVRAAAQDALAELTHTNTEVA